MVVAQLVEQLRPTQEFRGINQVNSKNFIELLLTIVLKDENQEKEAGNSPF